MAKRNVDALVYVSIFALLFLLGVSIGINDKIVKNFSEIGLMATMLTLGAVLGSIILAKVVYSYFFKRGDRLHEKNIIDPEDNF